MKSFNIKWDKIKDKFDENMIKSKKLPEFYDFYDSGKDFMNVYEPAEDTFLLIDSLNLDKQSVLNQIRKKIDNDPDKIFRSVEVGCGSGLVSATLVKMIREIIDENNLETKIIYKHYCLDVNKDAIRLTHNLMKSYRFEDNVEVVESDLFSFFTKNNIFIKFDIVVFNPPYVTTDDDEFSLALDKKDISAAWAGGKYGSEVIFRFIEKIQNFISYPQSVIYLLLSEENQYDKIQILMKDKYNLNCEVNLFIKRIFSVPP